MAALDFPNVQGLVDFKIEIGDFGPARAEVKDASGISNYNVKLVSVMHSNFAVVNQSGDMMWFWGSTDSQVHIITKLSHEQVDKKRFERDHIETPSCPHITPKHVKWTSDFNNENLVGINNTTLQYLHCKGTYETSKKKYVEVADV